MTREQQDEARQEYVDRFSNMSDGELIAALLEDRPKQGWVARRGVFLVCLKEELTRRGYVPSEL